MLVRRDQLQGVKAVLTMLSDRLVTPIFLKECRGVGFYLAGYHTSYRLIDFACWLIIRLAVKQTEVL